MKRRQNQVSRFGRRKGSAHRLQIPHLAYHYHVGVLTKYPF